MKDYTILKTPIKVGGCLIPTRYIVAPMTGGATNNADSSYTDTAINYFTLRAKGGFGLIIPGALSPDSIVDPYSALGPDPLKNKEYFIPQAKKLTKSIHDNGSKIFCQISMGLGRNYPGLPSCSINEVFGDRSQKSPELTTEQIKIKIKQMVEFAKVAKECGYDGIEVHAMHWGYLLDQFATSMFNHRTDEYGGNIENRLRAAREIVEGIHEACGNDYPVSMRLSLSTFIKAPNDGALTQDEENGRGLDESLECARLLEKYGYNMLNVDVGTYDSFYYSCPPMYIKQGFMREYVKDIKKYVSIPVFVGGRMNNPDDALELVSEGIVDGIALGRPSLADPELPNKVYTSRIEEIRPCLGCNIGCFGRLLSEGKPACCAVNPTAMRELEYNLKPLKEKKNILVIGGGVGGMEFARTATIRGHKVTLFEASDHLGGHLVEAGRHSFKQEINRLNLWYQNELKRLNVDVHLNTRINPDDLSNYHYDEIVVATGSKPVTLNIPGFEYGIQSLDAINHPEKLGKEVVVIGGGLVGCEIALDEAMKGKKVTVVEALDKILSSGVPAPLPNSMLINKLFDKYGVKVMTSTKLTQVKPDGVIVSHNDKEEFIKTDSSVMAIGFRASNPFTNATNVIGDAKQAKTIMNAIWEAFDLANNL